MVVLGINDGHDAGAALVKNGVVLAALQEERLRNVKNYAGVPGLAVKEVFKIAGVHPDDVSVVSIVSLNRTYAPLAEEPLRNKVFNWVSPFVHSHVFSKFYVSVLHRFRRMKELNKVLSDLGLSDKEFVFVEHHMAHAAGAFYNRPWADDTLILTLDGAGDGLSATVSVGSSSGIERVASTTYYDSPGNVFYSEITGYLGLKRWEHEYKVMGLAPYGRPEYCLDEMRRIVRVNPKRPLEFQNTIGACGGFVQKRLENLLRGQRFDNIAAACQRHFEDILVEWVGNAVFETGVRRLACAGGMFLNVKANKLLRESDLIDDLFVYPAAHDGGTPVGAALWAYHGFCLREGVKPVVSPLGSLYLGNEFSDEEVESSLREKGWFDKATFYDDVDPVVGGLLADGKIIGRFNGRAEWGPRALGNRSILADPRDLRVIRRLNFAIKHRDFWMPFAPAVLEERGSDYLVDYRFAPYMTEAFDTTVEGDDIIAALHPFDRTARPQIVNDWNPGYKRVIEAFEDKTGVGGILNTSFNLHGYPIVGTPETALWTLENSGLDGIMIGKYLFLK